MVVDGVPLSHRIAIHNDEQDNADRNDVKDDIGWFHYWIYITSTIYHEKIEEKYFLLFLSKQNKMSNQSFPLLLSIQRNKLRDNMNLMSDHPPRTDKKSEYANFKHRVVTMIEILWLLVQMTDLHEHHYKSLPFQVQDSYHHWRTSIMKKIHEFDSELFEITKRYVHYLKNDSFMQSIQEAIYLFDYFLCKYEPMSYQDIVLK